MKKHKLKSGTRQQFGKAKKPTLEPYPWDKGATGEANRKGLVEEQAIEADIETGEIINPNAVKRMRRVDMLEVWRDKSIITPRGWYAGVSLRAAYNSTERAPGWPDNDRVHSSPKPDHAVTIQIDRLGKFHAIYRHVIASDRPVIDACVLMDATPARCGFRNDRYQSGLKHLSDALDRLALAMGY